MTADTPPAITIGPWQQEGRRHIAHAQGRHQWVLEVDQLSTGCYAFVYPVDHHVVGDYSNLADAKTAAIAKLREVAT